jgi:hypothetical protein
MEDTQQILDEMLESLTLTEAELASLMKGMNVENPFLDDPPRVLYKYLSIERFQDFIESRRLRVSQRTVLNDVFELRGRFKNFLGDDYGDRFSSIVEAKLKNFMESDEFAIFIYRIHSLQANYTISKSHLRKFKNSLNNPILRKEIFNNIKFGVDFDKFYINLRDGFKIMSRCNMPIDALDNFGVLSLTENALNQPMWAHYTNNGTGVVVGINSYGRKFIRKPQKACNGTAYLSKIRYEDHVSESFFDNALSAFLVKNTDWSYEREWRSLYKLNELNTLDQTDNNGKLIYYTEFLADDILEIYYGYNIDRNSMARLSLECENLFPLASQYFIHHYSIEGLKPVKIGVDSVSDQ